MNAPNRLTGGLIDRKTPRTFTFDGKSYEGFEGDTLASALLANDVRLMGRSFKYHRPRGPLTAGSEEPNALVELRSGARREPNTRATMAELYEGLEAQSQNRWPSLAFDAMGVNDRVAPFLTAGFYYKTFMWPKAFWEKLYEPLIRKAAGLGSLSGQDDPDTYDHGHIHCDLLVIGSGPAGLVAALTAARCGARVVLAEEDFAFGGRLLSETRKIGKVGSVKWAASTITELASMKNVRLMRRTAINGAYDHGIYSALERVSDHLPEPLLGKPRQILWRIYSRRAVVCAGATERGIAFPNNDRPGIMLAGALRTYANRYAVTPGKRVALFINNDDALRTVHDLTAKGVDVVATIDVRTDPPRPPAGLHYTGAQVVDTTGSLGLTSITVRLADGTTREIGCDALGVSGGWNPNVHLTCHQRGRPAWNDTIAAFVPGTDLPPGMSVAGAAAGQLTTREAMAAGSRVAGRALKGLRFKPNAFRVPPVEAESAALTPFWHVTGGKGRSWLDQQNDVTVKDVELAHKEGFRAIEHLKRYTTLGMATDQGKTSNMGGIAVMAELTGQPIADTGTTMFRPPYAPTAIGAYAGRSRGREFKPERLTPSHQWAKEQGATFVESGLWQRAQWFPKDGETHWRESCDREALAVRNAVGVCDVTTLGKIDVQGRDAGEFLNRVYANGFAKLVVGRVRYGIMLREDGMVMDDGTTARFADDHFVMTTTTANAVPVFRHMEFARQCLYPDLDVQLISTTESWAQFAVAGPKSRDLLKKIVDTPADLSNEAFPFMACAEITVCGGLRARLFRISFSGELAYEIAVPTHYGDAMVRRLMEAGEEFGVVPYGLEALNVLRIEKGHVTANELNGMATADHMGLGRMVSTKKDSFGVVLSARDAMVGPDAPALIGIRPVDRTAQLVAGAHFVAFGKEPVVANDVGHVTSVCWSPTLGHAIGLGYLDGGRERIGEIVRAVSPLTGHDIEVEIVSTHFYDAEGIRQRG